MKIVKFKGGLGNQMFQYAYALLLKERTNEDVYVDYSAYQDLDNDTVRVPRISKFKLSLPPATRNEISKICKLRHDGNSQTFKYRVGVFLEGKINSKYFIEPNRAYIDPKKIADKSYFDGYWQSWRYVHEVKKQVKNEFIPNYELSEKTMETKKTMQSQNSVFIGVRRGDYGDEVAHYGSFGSEYYERAMAYIDARVENPIYYIFSNDIEWCKANIKWGNHIVEYREKEHQTNDFEELILMASCKHAIIVNRSYHWWGATLINNSQKIVVAPEKWFFDEKPIDIVPPEWTKIVSNANDN